MQDFGFQVDEQVEVGAATTVFEGWKSDLRQ